MYYSHEYRGRLFAAAAQNSRSGKTHAAFTALLNPFRNKKPLRAHNIAKILKRKFNGAPVCKNANPRERVLTKREIEKLQELAKITKFDPVNTPIIDARKIRDIFEKKINN